MTAVTIYAVPPLISALFLFSLAVVTLFSTARERLWLLFAGFCIVMAVSSLFCFLIETSGPGESIITFFRLGFFFALTALTFANLYGIALTGFRFGGHRRHVRAMRTLVLSLAVIWVATLTMLFLTDWVLADIEKLEHHGIRVTYGPAGWVLLGIYFMGTVRNFAFLYVAYRQAEDRIFKEFVGLNLLAFHTIFAPAIWLLFVLPVFGFPTQVLAFLAFPVSVLIFYVAIVRLEFSRVRDLNISLEQKVAERTEELKQTQVRLAQSERMASLGQLVAGVAHEMNNPVAAVKSMAASVTTAVERLKERTNAGRVGEREMNKVFEVVENAGKVIGEGTQRITRVVDDLKSFARLDAAGLQRTDVNKELEDSVRLLEHVLKPGVTIVTDLRHVPRVLCYPAQLNQVFLNLFMNANEAIDGHGTISVRTRRHDGGVRITVRDTGGGIAPENLKRVFEPGFTTKGRGVGTGLGLPICYQIVRDHRGTIAVKCQTGKGTTFTIDLPRDGPKRTD